MSSARGDGYLVVETRQIGAQPRLGLIEPVRPHQSGEIAIIVALAAPGGESQPQLHRHENAYAGSRLAAR